MTMDDEMDRDLERTRPSGEQAGARAGTTHPDVDEPMDDERRPEEARPEEPAEARAGTTHADFGQPMDEQRRPEEAERAQAPAGTRTPAAPEDGFDLLGDRELNSIKDRWEGVQATFVDDPAGAARQADAMVGEVLDHLQRRHRELHDEAGRRADGEADTEALRFEFLRYRTFFRTLLG